MFSRHLCPQWVTLFHYRAIQSSRRRHLVIFSQRRFLRTTPTLHYGQQASSSNITIDSSEVSHFDALASTWWDPYGPSRLLHLMNPLRHDFIVKCFLSQTDHQHGQRQKLHYLDIGCGGGIFAESAARLTHTASVTAIDPSAEVLAVAREHVRRDPLLLQPQQLSCGDGFNPSPKLKYLHTTVEELPVPTRDGDRADIVTAFEVIEHVPRPSSFLDAVSVHVKPGGWLILSTIARTWASWLTTKVMAEKVLQIVPGGTHDWNRYINRDELDAWFKKKGGWMDPEAMGVVYVPGFGWKTVPRTENFGNYFFGIRKK